MIKKLLGALLALFAAAAFAAVDANTATQAELEAVKGVGPALSGKIIDERKKAPFKDWQDMITRVKGVGEHNSTKFSAAGLTVNGTAYVAPPAKPSKVQSDAPAQAPKSATKLDTSKPAGAQPQSAEPAEADKAAKKTAAAAPADTKKGAKGAAVDTPQSSAPVTTPAANLAAERPTVPGIGDEAGGSFRPHLQSVRTTGGNQFGPAVAVEIDDGDVAQRLRASNDVCAARCRQPDPDDPGLTRVERDTVAAPIRVEVGE